MSQMRCCTVAVVVADAVHGWRQRRDEPVRELVGLVDGVRPELRDQPAASLRQERQVLQVEAASAHLVDERPVEPLEGEQRVRRERRHGIGGREHVRVAQDDEPPDPGTRLEAERRLGHDPAGRLRPHERPRDVEPGLGQELVEVVPAHPAGDVGVALADERAVAGRDGPERVEDRDGHEVAFARGHVRRAVNRVRRHRRRVRPDVDQLASVQRHPEPVHVVHGLARVDRVAPAGVVADHPAERAPGMRRGIRPEGEPVPLGLAAEVVEDDAGLDPRDPSLRVDLEDPRHVPAGVEHDRDVDGLPREARPRATREDGGVVLGADAEGCHDVRLVHREGDADRDVPVVRGVRRVRGPRAAVERHLAAHDPGGGPRQAPAGGRAQSPGRRRPPFPASQVGLPRTQLAWLPILGDRQGRRMHRRARPPWLHRGHRGGRPGYTRPP